jgi:membrane-associated protein
MFVDIIADSTYFGINFSNEQNSTVSNRVQIVEILAGISVIDIVLHLDKVLEDVIGRYQEWVYLILFTVIFCETGLVVTPFLPGDSLLFAAGSFAALPGNVLHVGWLYFLLSLAAATGDSTNYWIGRFTGPKIFHKKDVRFLNTEYLDKTHRFYEKYGPKVVLIGRFMPLFRTFVPFVAGIGRMNYLKFLCYSIAGTACWVGTFVLGGYFFGSLPVVKNNFTLVIMGIIVISLLPGAIGIIREKLKARREVS